MNDTIILRSTIRPELMRRTLMRGTIIGGMGIILLFLFPFSLLSLLAIPIITWGLLPYRKLTRLEKKPTELVISSDGFLIYQKVYAVPISSIKKIEYVEDENKYGIKILVEDRELFFPYYSERSFKSLTEQCHAS